ncbi:MAG: hypothetical protein M3Z21_08490, partial [Pseudomonadota bacterium]|nr:hypothetical protein [Pseudomonadota bacterium]
MRHHPSLRLRILLSYLAVGGLIAPVLAGFLLAVIYNLEEQLIGQHVQEELHQFIEQTRQKPELREQRFRYLSAYVQDGGEPPPPALAFTAGLAPGVHERVHGGLDYQVAIAERHGRRYTVIFDATEFEGWEVYLITIVAGGTLLSLYIAIWLG